ncbi:tyrosine-type recombinase/integrase [Arthrobacter dokdonensis]|uniref:tyrosine-type recombinase/integrase n=1 Tax=Arthrobacter dokdonellae TaxID=2211210 RepID=UPI001D131385|nr:tyrosine-type recombinase/integrase [Arthrobacter dokdonellae]
MVLRVDRVDAVRYRRSPHVEDVRLQCPTCKAPFDTLSASHAALKLRLHDLRHTHATLLLAAGVPVKVVLERLGHANATITLGVYAHVMPGMQQEAAEKIGALLYGGAP